MGGSEGKKSHADCYFLASAAAATLNYPLWKASAIHQSGFETGAKSKWESFLLAVRPPYRGVPAVITGMTWARATIFFGSDHGRVALNDLGAPELVSMTLPPLLLSTFVQVVNMPIVRASITIQNPQNYGNPNYSSTFAAIRFIAREKGVPKLWHGLFPGILKSVPKYVTSVVVKDVMEDVLPKPKTNSDSSFLLRAAVKSTVAALAGAILTNPMDVVRNAMFQTDLSMWKTIEKLCYDELAKYEPPQRRFLRSLGWMTRGLYANIIAVSVPINLTIFLTDVLIRIKTAN